MRKFIIATTALLVFVACKQPEPQNVLPAERCAVEIAPMSDSPVAAPSRADKFTFFAEGSKVGIYMVNYDLLNGTPGQLAVTGNHADNMCFIAGVDNVLRITPSVFYPDATVATKVDVYAYYPHTTTMSTSVTACPFTVMADQSVAANVAASDLCWAKNLRGSQNVGIVPSATPIPMEFVHKHSKIAISVIIPALSASGKEVVGITNLKVNEVYNSTTVNLATGVVTLKNSASDTPTSVIPASKQVGAADSQTAYLFEVIVPAQTFATGANLITFDLQYKDQSVLPISYKVSDATFGTSKREALAGKLHKINLKLNTAFEVILTGSQITDWVAGVTSGGEVDNKVTTSFKVKLATTAAAVDQVKVKTDVEGAFDIAKGVTFDATSNTCTFKFDDSKLPRDYGFRITELEFLSAGVSVSKVVKTSARVYTTGVMDLGTW